MILEPKFYPNTDDDNKCLQAATAIVLNSLGYDVSFDDVIRLTHYTDNLYSWPASAVIAINEYVKDVKLVGLLDYNEFAKRGEAYLKEIMEPEWFELQKAHASVCFSKEQEDAKKLVAKNMYEKKQSNLDDIDNYLAEYLIIALVDAGKLNSSRTSAHFVVLYGDERSAAGYLLHDPGLPPYRSRFVKKKQFGLAFKNSLILIPKNRIPFGSKISPNGKCFCGNPKKYKNCHGESI